MRIGVVLGILLLAFGGWAATGRASYKTKQEVVKVGDFQASVKESHAIPRWVGFVSLGCGVLVLLASAPRRK